MTEKKGPNRENVTKLEDFISSLGVIESGELFVELCVELLKEMGFTAIYRRRGSELGRDIDAKLDDQTWFFECKYSSKRVSTPEAAYKFLQLDMLHEDMKPDYFVLISNASMKSILKDIVEFKKVDVHTTYSVEVWTNEPHKQDFTAILLSYPEAYIKFLKSKLLLKGRQFDRLVDDFQGRSQQFLTEKPKFFDRYRYGTAVILRRHRGIGATVKFPIDEVHKMLTAGWMPLLLGFHRCIVTIGCPIYPTSGLYDFSDFKTPHALSEMLAPWGVIPVRTHNNCMEFAELDLHETFIFDFGAIATTSSLLAIPENNDCILMPEEWLKQLRNDCLRMRNFVKRGMLSTPAVFRTYIEFDVNYVAKNRYPHKRWVLGGIERFLPCFDDSGYSENLDVIVPSGTVQSDDIRVDKPFEMHFDIGLPLATSLWKNAGMRKPLLLMAKEVERQLIEDARSGSISFDKLLSSHYEWGWSFNWLFNQELIDTRYNYFEKLLNSDKNEKKGT